MIEARPVSLERYSDYVSDVREAVSAQGQPLRCALGYALPALHLPRDTNFFNALNDTTSRYVSKWKNGGRYSIQKESLLPSKANTDPGPPRRGDSKRFVRESQREHPCKLPPSDRRFYHRSEWLEHPGYAGGLL